MNLRDIVLFEPPEIGCVLDLTGLPSGGSKIYDRSPYGKVGTITGVTWLQTPGGIWCLSFDGVASSTNPVYIRARDPTGYNWNDLLALAKIHNRTLSALEIQNHFEREKSLFAVW